MRSHSRNDGLLADCCGGFSFQEHALYSSQGNALQIFRYFDELEVCNPLGTKVKRHELGELIDLKAHACNQLVFYEVAVHVHSLQLFECFLQAKDHYSIVCTLSLVSKGLYYYHC